MDKAQTQTYRQSLQRRYAEMMARKAGVIILPNNKKTLTEWLEKQLGMRGMIE